MSVFKRLHFKHPKVIPQQKLIKKNKKKETPSKHCQIYFKCS